MERRSVPWLVGGLVAEVALAAVDIATGESSFGRTWYLLPVLGMALGARSRDVALVGVLAFFLSLMSPVWHGSFGENAAVPLVTVAAGAALAVFAARQREAAMRARGTAETSAASSSCSPTRRGSPTARRTSTRRCGGCWSCSSRRSPTRPGST